MRRIVTIVLLAAFALAVPGRAAAGGGGDDERVEMRVRSACAGGTAELRLRAEAEKGGTDAEGEDEGTSGAIEIELRVDSRGRDQTLRIVLLRERTLVFQGVHRTRRAGTSFRWRRTVADWPGRETITARVVATSGRTCRLEATV